MLEILIGGAVALGLWELSKKGLLKIGPLGGFAVVPNHMYVAAYSVSGGQGGAPSQAQIQMALNSAMPGLWTAAAPNIGAVSGTFNVGLIYDGAAASSVTAAHMTSGLSALGMGTFTLTALTDMGVAPAPAAAA
jgi:hypothetical protein